MRTPCSVRPAGSFAAPLLSIVAALSTIAFCATASEVPRSSASLGMEDLVREYESDWNSVSTFYNLRWAPSQSNRLEQLIKEWQTRLEGAEFDAMDQQARIDYLLLRNELSASKLRLNRERPKREELEELLPFRQAIAELERARWRLEQLDPKAAASTVAQMADQVRTLRKRLEKGKQPPGKDSAEKSPPQAEVKAEEIAPLKVSPLLAARALSQLGGIRETLKGWFSFYDGYHPEFSWWMKKPYDDASAAFEEYGKFLREQILGVKEKEDGPLLGESLGPGAVAEDLDLEWVPYSAEEVIRIGEQEFAWCEAEMKKASREMGFGEDWKAALAKVKAEYVPPGGQDELVAEFGRVATKFVKDRDLVTVPPLCEETWRLTMTSPETQKTMPYVAYGGQNMQVAYAKQEMPQDDKLMAMRGNNRHFTRITTAHELIPGHHLQMFIAARERTHRRVFSTPFLVEGWALYWEMMLWDKGYGQSPEDRVGMLFWRMHRAARILVTLKFHLGRMQPQEMVDFLVDHVGHEKLGATSEVRRFITGDYSPLYQCAYMIGGLQLRALRKELVVTGRMSDRDFNDTVLSYNAIPVELIRAGMEDAPLTRDAHPTWKFAGDPPVAE